MRVPCWVSLVVATVLTSVASAALDFQAGTPTPAGSGLLDVPIYLHESGSPSAIAPGGLFSFGFSLGRTSGDASITQVTRNAAFDKLNNGSTTSFPTSTALLWAEQDANFGSGVSPDGSGLILLATVRFQQGLAGSNFSLGDFHAGTSETVTYGFTELDGQIAGGNFTIPAVPEPASLGLLTLGGLALLRRRRR